jgi:anaerobic selenocysteine-containing dehydrogenase
VGVYYGSGLGMDAGGFRMAQALTGAIGTRAVFSPLTIDNAGKFLVQVLMTGSPVLQPRMDYDRVKLVLFVGTNPMVSHGHPVAIPNPALTIRRIAAEGEVWVLDPLRTETARFATRHIAPRPGADWAVFAWLVREVLRDGASRDALASCAGEEELRAAVEPFDLVRAADLAGVPTQDLTDLLAAVRRAGRLAVELGTGVTMSAETANVTVWLAWALMILTDSMNRPGGMAFHPGFLERIDLGPLPVITSPFGPGPPSRPELQSFVGDWPCAALPDEIAAGNIRAFLNFGGAMMRSFPDSNALAPALAKLDVFMNIEVVANETTALSSHLLPSKDQLERADIMRWDRISPQINGHYTPAVMAPVGERRSAWWILAALMRRLGYEPPFPLPADDRAEGADDAVLAALAADARCGFDELKAQRYVATDEGLELPARWLDEHIARLGGWRLAPPLLVEALAQLERDTPAPPRLALTPRRQRRHLNAAFDFLDSPEVLVHPADAAAVGVADGEPVIVRSRRGDVEGRARLDPTLRRGVVSVPHGFCTSNVNLLTSSEAVDPVTGMAVYGAIPVTIHPASGGRAGAPGGPSA